jgi:hypothetical protein
MRRSGGGGVSWITIHPTPQEADMTSYLSPRVHAATATLFAVATLASAALAYDRHPPLRDDGAAWAAQHTAAAAPRAREHQGIEVVTLGVLPAPMLERQTGLSGHVMQLRAITLAPGGQIAVHGHGTRPGLVKVISGAWTEALPGVERVFDAAAPEAIVEGAYSTHWFFNRGEVPATALVCDIVPAG